MATENKQGKPNNGPLTHQNPIEVH
ncbi:uncharacterized protein G2W53_012246 [Senna tora]|uniref:Uncharacterized protein n=1 Tax=Senna tora TaxID=362788 RepID=A0A834TWR3_9FABA|nr:uncharacterized protein G2W53_012246 [Senna tora]